MKTGDIIQLYEEKKKQYGNNAHQHIAQIFNEIKVPYLRSKNNLQNPEKSWRNFKSRNLEKLVEYIITEHVDDLGLAIVSEQKLYEKANSSITLGSVARNLCLPFAKGCGMHLPEVDMVIYEPQTSKVIAVLLNKISVRLMQMGFWRRKLHAVDFTKHIKMFFITTTEDEKFSEHICINGDLVCKRDADACYVLGGKNFRHPSKVKPFTEFAHDLNKIIG